MALVPYPNHNTAIVDSEGKMTPEYQRFIQSLYENVVALQEAQTPDPEPEPEGGS